MKKSFLFSLCLVIFLVLAAFSKIQANPNAGLRHSPLRAGSTDLVLFPFRGILLPGNVVKLDWANFSPEVTTFIVERSSDKGETFTAIGSVLADSTQTEYLLLDDSPAPDSNYYRLQIVSQNNTIYFSQTVLIVVPTLGSDTFVLAPNFIQAGDPAYLLSNGQGKSIFTMMNAEGQVCIQKEFENNTPIETTGLASGVYLYWIYANSQVFRGKCIIR
jgi:hypothetical protein